MKKLVTGIVGCGMISEVYIRNIQTMFGHLLEIRCCCAKHMESAEKRAAEFGIKACTFGEMLADSEIELVVILTPASTHYELIKQALMAGKHVYTEKTLSANLKQAGELVLLAEEKGLYLGAAPDTFLGASLRKAREIVDSGKLGKITSFHISYNHDINYCLSFARFLCLEGGGICYDMGVYYLTALINLLGPVEKTAAMVANHQTERPITDPESEAFGEILHYENESQVAAIMRTQSGVSGTFAMNGDTIQQEQPALVLYGTKGMLVMSDPNYFGGTIRFIPNFYGDTEDQEIETICCDEDAFADNSRGLGVADMAIAIREKKPYRASGELAYHVLDVIEQMMESSRTGEFRTVHSKCSRPEALGESEISRLCN